MRSSPSLPELHELDRLQVGLLEVQPVGDHQLDVGSARRRVDHLLALLLGHRHRLLAQHVHARLGRAHGVLAVQVVGQRDVDGVDLAAAQAGVVLVVGVRGARRRTCLPAQSRASRGRRRPAPPARSSPWRARTRAARPPARCGPGRPRRSGPCPLRALAIPIRPRSRDLRAPKYGRRGPRQARRDGAEIGGACSGAARRRRTGHAGCERHGAGDASPGLDPRTLLPWAQSAGRRDRRRSAQLALSLALALGLAAVSRAAARSRAAHARARPAIRCARSSSSPRARTATRSTTACSVDAHCRPAGREARCTATGATSRTDRLPSRPLLNHEQSGLRPDRAALDAGQRRGRRDPHRPARLSRSPADDRDLPRADGLPRARANHDRKLPAVLRSIYVEIGFLFSIDYVLLRGYRVADGRPVQEKVND